VTRIGVYIDGYNLYYGARGLCGRSTPGWRWLDLRALACRLLAEHAGRPQPSAVRVVYCTARIKGADNPQGQVDQDTYLRALRATGSVDRIEYGLYVCRVATAPLATKSEHGKVTLAEPKWPIVVKDAGGPVGGAMFIASVARREEKGSDVNVATHLLHDVLRGEVDAAVVISNDSDLRLPGRDVAAVRAGGTGEPDPELPGRRAERQPERGRRRPLVVPAAGGRRARVPATGEGRQPLPARGLVM
jgi:uncharacterized LabA/DUF88 family protein